MKTLARKLKKEYLPYFILWLILIFFSILTFSSFIFTRKVTSFEQAAPYVQGYFIRSDIAGSVRIIPFAGASLKSPVSNTIKAVISPYIEEDENKLPAKQKPKAY